MNIITITLAPALDLQCKTESFTAERENFATVTSREAGGKGINVSRALGACGIESQAIVALGKENGEAFLSSLKQDGICCVPIWCEGAIRENITVHTCNTKETRLSFSGFSGDCESIKKAGKLTDKLCQSGDIAVLAGSLPSGIDKKDGKVLVKALKSRGVKVVIDSRSFTPEDIVECAPFLIKPKEEEIVAYTGTEINTEEDAKSAALLLFGKGIENVMISLGARGAVLACAEGVYFTKPPKIDALSTIGAGDSSIAGFIAAYKNKKRAEDCLKSAVAYGSAACLTEGTKPPKKEDIEAFIDQL